MQAIGQSKMYSKAQQLGKRTKKKSKNFSEKTKLEIFERDEWRCVKCHSYLIESVPHHIHYKSAGGTGTKDNGCTVCRNCHNWAHHKEDSKFGEPSKDGRKWFEEWRLKNLDENGNRI